MSPLETQNLAAFRRDQRSSVRLRNADSTHASLRFVGRRKNDERFFCKTVWYGLIPDKRDMRRVQSAPANLCKMHHCKRAKAEVTTTHVVVSRALRRGDALDQVVDACSKEAQIHDSTEILLLDILARWVVLSSVKWDRILPELCIRLIVSYVTRTVMDMLMETIHTTLPHVHLLGH